MCRARTIVACLLGFLMVQGAFAQEPYLKFSDQGGVLRGEIGGIPFVDKDVITLLAPDWTVACHRAGKGVPSTSPTGASIWTWDFKGGSLVRTLEAIPDGWRTSFDFSYDKGLNGKCIQLCLETSKVCMDFPKGMIPGGSFETPLTLHSLAGDIVLDPTGSTGGKWSFDDFREAKWHGKFRITFSAPYNPASGAKGRAVLSITAKPAPSPAFVQLPLNADVSRSFADDDSHAGWTGQGHENDLSTLPAGQLSSAAIPFNITGRAIVLRGSNTPAFPLSSGLMKFPAPVKSPTLYFLHTAAWNAKFNIPVAEYDLVYEDGSVERIPVRYGHEIIDWWAAMPAVNARVAWKGRNGGNHLVGVYMVRADNPYPEKALKGIEFKSTNSSCTPALLAITAINSAIANKGQIDALEAAFRKNIPPPLDTKGWKPCVIAWNGGIQPGSAIDFSFLNHKPAGKFGFLKRVGGEFEFEGKPGETVRFWGTNFAIEGPFPDKSLSPGIAGTLAAQGVNLVRLHLYAARPYLLQSRDGGLNPQMLDKMFFLIAELEKNGIYLYMDWNDGICYDELLKRPSTFQPEEHLKYSSFFDPELKKATKRLAELLFTTVNPYTGKALANDPGIAMFEIMNEASMLQNWLTISTQIHGPYRVLLENLWNNWLKSNHLAARPLPMTNFDGDPAARRFATEMDRAYFNEMRDYLHSIGVKAPVCGTNFTFNNGNFVAQAQMDFFGDHMYWAHPSFSFGVPGACPTSAALERPLWTAPVGSLGPCALAGYPAVHSEWNYCFPNPCRSEGIPIAASYAAYQGWDGMIFYGATGSCDEGIWNRFLKNPAIMTHSQQTDPATWGLSQIGAVMFRRGDVEQAKRVLNVVLPESVIYESVMPLKKMPFLPALGRYEVSFAKKANWLGELAESSKEPALLYPDVLRHLGAKESNSDRIVSDTRQIRRYDKPALLFVDTPKTQSVTGRLCDIEKSGDSLSLLKVNTAMTWGSVNATAIDGLPLTDSKRILFVAVANAANTGERLEGGYLVSMGKAPVLLEPFQSKITLKSSLANAKLYAVASATGARIAELPLTKNGGAFSFQLDGSQGTIYFELVAE